MKKKSTHKGFSFLYQILIVFIYLSFNSTISNAQSFCDNETVYWLETFGTGSAPSSNPDVIDTALTYQDTGSLYNEGRYRVANSTHQKPEWQDTSDHTANDIDGKTLVVNGRGETFYHHTVNRPQKGFEAGSYSSSLFLMNVNKSGTCGVNALLPTISFIVEYRDTANNWIALSGSPVTVASVPQTVKPKWIQVGGIFVLPITDFKVEAIRVTMSDGTHGGCGNDYAIDDISFALCPSGSPLPVDLLNLGAYQKGSGISIVWETSTETNSKYFDVEQSTNGNSNWRTVATVQGSGSNSTVKSYNIYDAKPFSGLNYYRVKQVDKDNVYKYSKTVSVKINLDKTGVTVLSNPFTNFITIDFLSKNNHPVSVRLVNITGKVVAAEKWNITSGSSRKEFQNLAGLERGMYYLSVADENGTILLNSKLIKQ